MTTTSDFAHYAEWGTFPLVHYGDVWREGRVYFYRIEGSATSCGEFASRREARDALIKAAKGEE